MRDSRGTTLVDMLCLTIGLALALAMSVILIDPPKKVDKRMHCASNLRGLGQAHYIYAQDEPFLFPATFAVRKENDGAMVLFDPKNRTKQPSSTGIPSPTVDLWAIVRVYNATPKQFICPSTKDEPDPAKDTAAYYDFESPKNLSYGYQYQYDPNRRPIGVSSDPTFPFMADGNPYIKGKIKEDATEDRASKFQGNSTNHTKKTRQGENVLFQDGHTSFEKTPAVGLLATRGPSEGPGKKPLVRDNVYTVGEKPDKLDPGEAPTTTKCNLVSKSDACLVP